MADEGVELFAFERGASGEAEPMLGIPPANRRDLWNPRWRLAMDGRGWIYLSGKGGVRVYAPEPAGNAKPLVTVPADSAPDLFAFDWLDRVYALRRDTVSVFERDTWGRRPPLRILAMGSGVSDMVVDRAGNLYVANKDSSFIAVYRPGQDTPRRSGGSPGDGTRVSQPVGLALDRRDNLYVVNGPQPTGRPGLRIYAPRCPRRGSTGADHRGRPNRDQRRERHRPGQSWQHLPGKRAQGFRFRCGRSRRSEPRPHDHRRGLRAQRGSNRDRSR